MMGSCPVLLGNGNACGLPNQSARQACILHDPDPSKPVDVFTQHLQDRCRRSTKGDIGLDCTRLAFPPDFQWDEGIPIPRLGVVFRETIFLGAVVFSDMNFGRTAVFVQTAFLGDTYFRHCRFEELLIGEKTVVKEGTLNFTYCDFEGSALLDEIAVEGTLTFMWSRVSRFLRVSSAVVKGELVLQSVRAPNGDIAITSSQIGTSMRLTNSDAKFVLLGSLWRDAATKEPARVDLGMLHAQNLAIENVDLSHWTLTPPGQIGMVTFNVVEFPTFRGRSVLWEDKLWRTGSPDAPDPEIIEVAYRRLKGQAMRASDQEAASIFYFGERDVLRCRTPWRQFGSRLLLSAYLVTCGYGERPFRIAAWNVGLIIAFALAYLFGVGLVGPEGYVVSYRFAFSPEHSGQFLEGAVDALVYSLRSWVPFANAGANITAPDDSIPRLLSIVESTLGVLFIALFAVAFTRKLAR